jgi:hypothetical protein
MSFSFYSSSSFPSIIIIIFDYYYFLYPDRVRIEGSIYEIPEKWDKLIALNWHITDRTRGVTYAKKGSDNFNNVLTRSRAKKHFQGPLKKGKKRILNREDIMNMIDVVIFK